MRSSIGVNAVVFMLSVTAGCTVSMSGDRQDTNEVTRQIIALERSALNRWFRSDPHGYLDLYALDVSYFDPMVPGRIDGLAAMRERLAPMMGAALPYSSLRYEMHDPRLQLSDNTAVLTFNLTSFGLPASGDEVVIARWNATEVYVRTLERWRIAHSHWSHVTPDARRSVY